MKFLEVLCVGFDFYSSLVVAQSLRALDSLDYLGFDWISYESNHLVKYTLVEESHLVFLLCKTSKSLRSKFGFHF